MEVTLNAKLMDVKMSKNGKRYLVLYADGSLFNVFLKEENKTNYNEHLGKDVNIKVKLYEPKFIQAV